MAEQQELTVPQFDLDWPTLEGWNLDPNLVGLATCTTDAEPKRQVSLLLLKQLNARKQLRKSGTTHLRNRPDLVPESAVKMIAVAMFQSCVSGPPLELVCLLAALLGVEGRRNSAVRSRRQRREAIWYVADHPDASDREVARAVGVSSNTVRKWRSTPYFEDAVRGVTLSRRAGLVLIKPA